MFVIDICICMHVLYVDYVYHDYPHMQSEYHALIFAYIAS